VPGAREVRELAAGDGGLEAGQEVREQLSHVVAVVADGRIGLLTDVLTRHPDRSLARSSSDDGVPPTRVISKPQSGCRRRWAARSGLSCASWVVALPARSGAKSSASPDLGSARGSERSSRDPRWSFVFLLRTGEASLAALLFDGEILAMTATLTKTAGQHDEAISREYPGLLAYCRRLDWNAPEDLAQEAAARTIKRLATTDIDDLGAYLRATARHVRADLVRRRHSREITLVADPDIGHVEDPDIVEQMALSHGLGVALRNLKPRELEVLRMADIEEQSIEQIAARTGYSTSSATSLLYRTRQKVRADLERMKQKGLLALSGPAAFFRQLATQLGGDALGLAAAAGVAVLAVAASGVLGTQSSPVIEKQGSAVTSLVRDAGPVDRTVGSTVIKSSAPVDASSRSSATKPSERPENPKGPGALLDSGPIGRITNTRPANESEKQARAYPFFVAVGTNCSVPTEVYGSPWGDDNDLVNIGQPPGSEAVHVQVETQTPDAYCPLTQT
jgi:RNA polymerase sigma factor (sigma-70 family)